MGTLTIIGILMFLFAIGCAIAHNSNGGDEPWDFKK